MAIEFKVDAQLHCRILHSSQNFSLEAREQFRDVAKGSVSCSLILALVHDKEHNMYRSARCFPLTSRIRTSRGRVGESLYGKRRRLLDRTSFS